MSIGKTIGLGLAAIGVSLGGIDGAYAANLFKGIVTITARTNTPACVQEFDVNESFIAEYRANVGAEAGNERLAIISTNGSLLLTNTDAAPSLRGVGTVSITGNAYALPVAVPSTGSNFTISAVVAATTVVTITGAANNVGIAGCTVAIRGALTLLPPGGY